MTVNGQEIEDYVSFLNYVTRTKPGEELTFKIKRDEKEMFVKVTIEARRRRR